MKTKFQVGNVITPTNIDPMPGNSIAPPLIVGKDYTVKKIIQDSKGHDHIDVGLVSKYNWITSHDTGEELPDGDKIHWCHPSRFQLSTF